MPALESDIAQKVLSADLRNIVKKVGEGGTLTPAEREIMERCLVQGEVPPEDLQKARQAALIRRWATGAKMSKDELRELGASVPDGRAAATRVTAATYKHKLRHYAEQLGITNKDATRKLKAWIQKGRTKAPPDLPPFDQLDQMAEWWRRNMEWRVPDYILALEGQPATPPSPQAQAQPTVQSPGAPPAPGQPVPPPMAAMEIVEGLDADADIGLQQARTLLVSTYNQMVKALAIGNTQQYSQLRREWSGLAQTVRQWEKDIIPIMAAKGTVLSKRDLTAEMVGIFSILAFSFQNAMMTLSEKLAPQIPAAERRGICLPLRDSVFAHLKKTRYREAWDAVKAVP